MKAGSLDNYLITTKPALIGSKFGLYLRDIIIEKKKNPETFKYDYIPGSSKGKRTRKTKLFKYRQMPAMYTPASIRATTDFSAFYEKSPAEMSRYELQELERLIIESQSTEVDQELLSAHAPEYDENGVEISVEDEFIKTDEFKDLQE